MKRNTMEFIEVKLPVNPDDYINNDGLDACYDVGCGEYVIVNGNEEIFSTCDDNCTIIMVSCNDSRLLLNGELTPSVAFKFLYDNNFIDNSTIYVFSNNDNFDYREFSQLTSLSNPEVYLLADTEESIEKSVSFLKDTIQIANDNGDVKYYDIAKVEENNKIK